VAWRDQLDLTPVLELVAQLCGLPGCTRIPVIWSPKITFSSNCWLHRALVLRVPSKFGVGGLQMTQGRFRYTARVKYGQEVMGNGSGDRLRSSSPAIETNILYVHSENCVRRILNKTDNLLIPNFSLVTACSYSFIVCTLDLIKMKPS